MKVYAASDKPITVGEVKSDGIIIELTGERAIVSVTKAALARTLGPSMAYTLPAFADLLNKAMESACKPST